MGLPNASDVGPIPPTEPDEARSAAVKVADVLEYECQPALEALGLIGYTGHDMQSGRWRAHWREGTVNP